MIEYKSDKDGFTSSMQTLTTILSLIVFSVLFVFYRQLADVIGLSKPIMLLMMIDIVFSAGMSFWSIRNRYEYKYKSVAVFTILSSLLMPVLSVILVLNSAEHKAEDKNHRYSCYACYCIWYCLLFEFNQRKESC